MQQHNVFKNTKRKNGNTLIHVIEKKANPNKKQKANKVR